MWFDTPSTSKRSIPSSQIIPPPNFNPYDILQPQKLDKVPKNRNNNEELLIDFDDSKVSKLVSKNHEETVNRNEAIPFPTVKRENDIIDVLQDIFVNPQDVIKNAPKKDDLLEFDPIYISNDVSKEGNNVLLNHELNIHGRLAGKFKETHHILNGESDLEASNDINKWKTTKLSLEILIHNCHLDNEDHSINNAPNEKCTKCIRVNNYSQYSDSKKDDHKPICTEFGNNKILSPEEQTFLTVSSQSNKNVLRQFDVVSDKQIHKRDVLANKSNFKNIAPYYNHISLATEDEIKVRETNEEYLDIDDVISELLTEKSLQYNHLTKEINSSKTNNIVKDTTFNKYDEPSTMKVDSARNEFIFTNLGREPKFEHNDFSKMNFISNPAFIKTDKNTSNLYKLQTNPNFIDTNIKPYLETVTKDEKLFRKKKIVRNEVEKVGLTKGASLKEKSIALPPIMERLTMRKKILLEKRSLERRLILDPGSNPTSSTQGPQIESKDSLTCEKNDRGNATNTPVELNPIVLMEDCNYERLKAFEKVKFIDFVQTGRYEK